MDYFGLERHLWAWIVAAVFAFLATVLYVLHVRLHLLYNHHPLLRKQTIRILTMVPIYAIEAWLGLFMKSYSLIWDVLRECYEAFVIYSFLHFLIEYLGGQDQLIKILSKKTMQRKKAADKQPTVAADTAEIHDSIAEDRPNEKSFHRLEDSEYSSSVPSSSSTSHQTLVPSKASPELTAQLSANPPPLEEQGTVADIDLYAIPISLRSQPHLRPFSWFMKPWTLPYQFLFRCRVGILQYVFVKIVMAIITFSTDAAGVYEANQFRFDGGYIYTTFFNNASQIYAMYCLVLFYMAVSDELKPIRPVPKFLCIKAVVFFTFWQSVLIAFLVFIGDINATQTYSTDDVATGIQDFCICIEMFIAAVVHFYAFPAREFQHEATVEDANKPIRRLLQVVSPMDMVKDMKDLRRMEQMRKQRKKEIEAQNRQHQLDEAGKKEIHVEVIPLPDAGATADVAILVDNEHT